MSEASDMVNYLKDQAAVAAGGALNEALQLANQESATLHALARTRFGGVDPRGACCKYPGDTGAAGRYHAGG